MILQEMAEMPENSKRYNIAMTQVNTAFNAAINIVKDILQAGIRRQQTHMLLKGLIKMKNDLLTGVRSPQEALAYLKSPEFRLPAKSSKIVRIFNALTQALLNLAQIKNI